MKKCITCLFSAGDLPDENTLNVSIGSIVGMIGKITNGRGLWGGGVKGLKSAFHLSRSYHRLQVGFDSVVYGGVCGCWCGELI